MTLKDLKHELDLHLKDYKDVRGDVDKILDWIIWIAKIIVGAVVISVLALIGLKK